MKKKIMIIIILLLIVNVIMLVALLNFKSSDPEDEMISTPGEQYSFELNGKIFPENYNEFELLASEANIDEDQIYETIYNIVKGIPNLNDDLSENESVINNYYKSNEEYINNTLGIKNSENFVKLIKLVKKIYSSDVNYTNVKLLTDDTFNHVEGKITCEFEIIYSNNKKITFQIIIKTNTGTTFEFIPKMEE